MVGLSHLQDVDELRSALAYIFPEQTEQELQDFIDRVCHAAVTNQSKDALWAHTSPPVSSASARKCASR